MPRPRRRRAPRAVPRRRDQGLVRAIEIGERAGNAGEPSIEVEQLLVRRGEMALGIGGAPLG